MEGLSSVSGQSKEQKFDADGAEWEAQLNGVEGNKNGWKTENNVPENDLSSIIDKNGEFKPEVRKVLNNFIGNMTIEMVKNQSPAQKISMDDDE